jgi:hypothetical protein
MDEVETVARVLHERNPEWYGNVFGAMDDARAAIAALDACRDARNGFAVPRGYIPRVGMLNKVHALGRDAGLREAAAVATRERETNRYGDDNGAYAAAQIIERDILALIDAGSRTPPTKD